MRSAGGKKAAISKRQIIEPAGFDLREKNQLASQIKTCTTIQQINGFLIKNPNFIADFILNWDEGYLLPSSDLTIKIDSIIDDNHIILLFLSTLDKYLIHVPPFLKKENAKEMNQWSLFLEKYPYILNAMIWIINNLDFLSIPSPYLSRIMYLCCINNHVEYLYFIKKNTKNRNPLQPVTVSKSFEYIINKLITLLHNERKDQKVPECWGVNLYNQCNKIMLCYKIIDILSRNSFFNTENNDLVKAEYDLCMRTLAILSSMLAGNIGESGQIINYSQSVFIVSLQLKTILIKMDEIEEYSGCSMIKIYYMNFLLLYSEIALLALKRKQQDIIKKIHASFWAYKNQIECAKISGLFDEKYFTCLKQTIRTISQHPDKNLLASVMLYRLIFRIFKPTGDSLATKQVFQKSEINPILVVSQPMDQQALAQNPIPHPSLVPPNPSLDSHYLLASPPSLIPLPSQM
ncbi:MAG: hypothetical protein HAW62_01250 [Endozoicomonadaceae bacterium]|nr:hypothetical protein [Endozoicomonadaceae bacterium]